MPHQPLNGVNLYYDVDGEGVALMLIAGLASDGASWAPVRGLLAKHFRLILPDNRGSGRTEPSDAHFTFADVAADLDALLAHLGVARAHVVGHSMGAMLAATFAARHPERVDRLILAAASAGASPRNAALFQDLARVRGYDEDLYYRLFFQWLFAPGFFADPAQVSAAVAMSKAYPFAQTPQAHAAQLQALASFDPAVLAQVRAPTLALCGEKDLLFSPAEIRAGLSAVPGLTVETVAEAAHSLHWDQPDAFAQAVRAFLA